MDIELRKANSGGHRAYWNGVHVGEIDLDLEGAVWNWWPRSPSPKFSHDMLYSLAKTLEELNENWKKEIRKAATGATTDYQTGKDYKPGSDTIPF